MPKQPCRCPVALEMGCDPPRTRPAGCRPRPPRTAAAAAAANQGVAVAAASAAEKAAAAAAEHARTLSVCLESTAAGRVAAHTDPSVPTTRQETTQESSPSQIQVVYLKSCVVRSKS